LAIIGLRFDESPLSALPLVRRHRGPSPKLSPGRIPAQARAIALRGWEQRLRSEYAGMLLARRFHGLTIQLNAPLDVQEIALTIQHHEQRHAGYCHAAAASLGGSGELGFDTARLDGGDLTRPSGTAFWETVCGEFAVSETVAFGLLAFSVRSLPPSGYRRILETILADEALHTRIGFLLLSRLRTSGKDGAPAWIEAPDEAWIRDYVRRYVAIGLERDVVDPREADGYRNPVLAAPLGKLGIPEPSAFAAVYKRGLLKEVPARFRAIGIRI
jgi:hypothetical protein